jgi:hypothetical protein
VRSPTRDLVVVVDDVVGAQRGCRDELAGGTHAEVAAHAPELAGVDANVPVVGVLVAIESLIDVGVAHHRHRAERVGECGAPADVVRVAMCVHEVGDGRRGPPPDRCDDVSAGAGVGGIEGDEAVAGVQHHRVRETLDDRQPVGEFRQFVGDAVDRFVGHTGIDDP